MRLLGVLLVLILAAAPLVAVAQEKPPIDLPELVGGEVTMEINMTSEDILPTVKAMLPLLMSSMGKDAETINSDEVANAFQDVKRIEMLQVDYSKSDKTESDIAAFYAKNAPPGDFTRVFWQSKKLTGTMAVYSSAGGEKLYMFRVRTVVEAEKSIKKIEVAKTEGKIDYAKLIPIAMRFFE
jgi:hypothetical protein